MELDHVALGRRLREVREAARVSQHDAADAIEVSQPTYSRIEQGQRPLKGDEIVVLADLLGVRAAAITAGAQIRRRARIAARTDGTASPMAAMRERLYAYLELDEYLTEQGVAMA
ncbi:MAG: helix-turn-helix transcriptional regulator [Mycobacteriales bacterium]